MRPSISVVIEPTPSINLSVISVTDTRFTRYAYVMRLAIADPPYLGQSHRYPEHSEAVIWDSPQTHLDLLDRLQQEYEGWVFACTVPMLALLLPVAPQGTRVGVWAKTRAGGSRPFVRVGYAFEHLLFQQPPGRRGGLADMRRTDTLIAPVSQRRGVVGAKPQKWTQWVLDLMGYDPDKDEVHDLYPRQRRREGGYRAISSRLPLVHQTHVGQEGPSFLLRQVQGSGAPSAALRRNVTNLRVIDFGSLGKPGCCVQAH